MCAELSFYKSLEKAGVERGSSVNKSQTFLPGVCVRFLGAFLNSLHLIIKAARKVGNGGFQVGLLQGPPHIPNIGPATLFKDIN